MKILNLAKKESLLGYASIIPAFLFIAVFFGIPIVSTIYHSFTKWDGLNTEWVGIGNYVKIFTNGELWSLLKTNFVFLLSMPGIVLLCLVVTVLLYEEVTGWKFFRSVYYIPTILSAVVVGFLMKTLFAEHGALSILADRVGLGSHDWLGHTTSAFMILIFCYYWQSLGQGVLILLAGMAAISNEMFEAAKIDGANWGHRLLRIVIPSLVPSLFYFTFINITWIFVGLFPLTYSVTGGGPGYSTTPIDFMIYLKGFQSDGAMGYASALSVLLFLIVLVFTWVQFRVSERFSD
ncbi:carbohydrate ABC transporter permease [Paenibacillus rhizovicinus]|uniref:carbohydrate ABC transporter permease n=1 Tax=Paenibacillus rhizovicinus TaxID=2704463 RepID=UPI0038503155